MPRASPSLSDLRPQQIASRKRCGAHLPGASLCFHAPRESTAKIQHRGLLLPPKRWKWRLRRRTLAFARQERQILLTSERILMADVLSRKVTPGISKIYWWRVWGPMLAAGLCAILASFAPRCWAQTVGPSPPFTSAIANYFTDWFPRVTQIQSGQP